MRTRITRVVCAATAAGALSALGVTGAGAAGAASTAPRARPAHPVTAYVANQLPGTVTPIDTATNKALQGDQGRTRSPSPSRSPRTGRPPTSPTPAITAIGHGDPDQHRHQQGRQGDHGRGRPQCHRDHPEREDRLRRQLRLGHGDPDQHRHQHRGQGRSRSARTPGAIAITPDGKTAYVASHGHGHGDPDQHRHQQGRQGDQGRRPAVRRSRSRPNGKTAYVVNASGHA